MVMQSLTVLEDHWATVKLITSSSGHSSPSAYLCSRDHESLEFVTSDIETRHINICLEINQVLARIRCLSHLSSGPMNVR